MNLISYLARVPLLVLLFILLPGPEVFADHHDEVSEPVTCQIEYWSVGDLQERNENGWLLAWKAKVSGDLAGEMRWWFPETPPAPESEYSHGKIGYYVARWELWVDGELVMSGKSAGKTVIADGEDGIWDGHGIVVEANGDLSSLRGRKTYETGTVIMPSDPSGNSTGSGMFVIY